MNIDRFQGDGSSLREDIVERLANSFASPENKSVILLEVEKGICRSTLIRSAIAKLQVMDRSPSLVQIDLEGFEPDCSTLSSFQEYCRLKGEKYRVNGNLFPCLLPALPPTTWNAALHSLLASSALYSDSDTLSPSFPAGEVSALRGGRKTFLAVLQALTAKHPRICFLPDTAMIPDPLLHSLITEAETNPNFLLVLSCRTGELRLRSLLGLPKETLRLRAAAVVATDFRISLEQAFGEDIWVHLQEISKAPVLGMAAGTLSRFLVLAGLCGEIIPSDLLLDYLGVSGEARDYFIDFVDQTLVERGLLEDLEYGHPSFSGCAVYRFASPLVAQAALGEMPDFELSRLRDGFLAFLKETLKPETRGGCRLLLEIASGAACDEWEPLLQMLVWWGDEEEVLELENLLSEALAAGHLGPEVFWRTVETADHWPGFRRLALLEAYGRQLGGVPARQAGQFHALRALAFYDLRRPAECLTESVAALNLLSGSDPQDARLLANCHALAGLISLEKGRLSDTRVHLAMAMEAAGNAEVTSVHQTAESIGRISDSLRNLDPERLVRSALERILSISRCTQGFEGCRVAELWESIADVLREAGQIEPARLTLERAVGIERRFAGTHDLQLAAVLKNLADLYREIGETSGARKCFEEAFMIEASFLGQQEQQVSILRNNLIDVLLEVDDLKAAWKYLIQALTVARLASGEESPEVLVLLKRLTHVADRLGDPEAALKFLTEALQVEKALKGPNDPDMGVTLKQLADLHAKLGNRDETISCRMHALRIEEAVYGKKALRILGNLKILEVLLRQKGDQTAADSLCEQARLIESRA